MRRRGWIASALVGLSLVWLVPQSAAETSRIRAAGSQQEGWRWRPDVRHLSRGDRVVWTNPTGRTHTVTAYGGNWNKNSRIAPGERTRARFRRTGTYKFRCMTEGHSALNNGRCVGMCGKVRVH